MPARTWAAPKGAPTRCPTASRSATGPRHDAPSASPPPARSACRKDSIWKYPRLSALAAGASTGKRQARVTAPEANPSSGLKLGIDAMRRNRALMRRRDRALVASGCAAGLAVGAARRAHGALRCSSRAQNNGPRRRGLARGMWLERQQPKLDRLQTGRERVVHRTRCLSGRAGVQRRRQRIRRLRLRGWGFRRRRRHRRAERQRWRRWDEWRERRRKQRNRSDRIEWERRCGYRRCIGKRGRERQCRSKR